MNHLGIVSRTSILFGLVHLVALCSAGCHALLPYDEIPWQGDAADGPGARDGGADHDLVADTALPDSDAQRVPCDQPGQPCVHPDPCAIKPVCGADHVCRPSSLLDCNDGLSCTTDSCKEQGVCDNTPAAGYCVLELSGAPGVSCVKAGTLRGNGSCDVCEPSTSQVAWSDGEGRPCDDGDPCTMGDICSSGACQGLDYGYLCNDGLYCTDDLCDGIGGCAGSKLQLGFCVVNALCYKHQQLHPHGACSRCDVGSSTTSWTPFTGGCVIDGSCYPPGFQPRPCASCDTSKSTTAWTIASGSCLIDNSCHKAGDKDAGGCSRCDPAKNATAWTTIPNQCDIDDTCYPDKYATGCLVCDVATSSTSWSPASGATIKHLSFESGSLAGWTVSPARGSAKVGWHASKLRSHAGSWSLYYGSELTKDYDTPGKANSGSAQVKLSLLKGQKHALMFRVRMDLGDAASPKYDMLQLQVNGAVAWTKADAPEQKVWHQVTLDLGALTGTDVVLRFEFDTGDSVANSSEGVFIDDIRLLAGC